MTTTTKWAEALDNLLHSLESHSYELANRYSESVATTGSSRSGWLAHWELRGTHSGIRSLKTDLSRAIESCMKKADNVKGFTECLISWLKGYRFDEEFLKEEYGVCCIRKLKRTNETLVHIIEQGNLEGLKKAEPRFVL
jgi:hypothetical protein